MEPLATLGAVAPKDVDHGGDTRCVGNPRIGGGQLGDLRGRRTPDMPDITAMEGGKAT